MRGICLFLLLGCACVPASVAAADLFIATADAVSGSAALLGEGQGVVRAGLLSLPRRVRMRYQDRRIYLLLGDGRDRLMTMIPSAWLAPVVEFSTGPGSDPQDVVAMPNDELWLTRRNRSDLIRVDAFSGAVLARIDLSAMDTDGIPDMTDMVIDENRLFVLCERSRSPTATIAVIDLDTERLIDTRPEQPGTQGLDLAGSEPVGVIQMGTTLIVGTGAGIEQVRLGGERRLLISSEQLGGIVRGLALRSNRQGFVSIERDGEHQVLPVDLLARSAGTPLPALSGGPVNDLAIDEDRLYVADDGAFELDFAAGIYLFDIGTGQLISGPLNAGQKPKELVVVASQTVTGLAESLAPAAAAVSWTGVAYPNPFNATVRIALSGPDETRRVDIFDALGRRVRSLQIPERHEEILWNGLDDQGSAVASGTYILRWMTRIGPASRRVVLVR